MKQIEGGKSAFDMVPGMGDAAPKEPKEEKTERTFSNQGQGGYYRDKNGRVIGSGDVLGSGMESSSMDAAYTPLNAQEEAQLKELQAKTLAGTATLGETQTASMYTNRKKAASK